ncbi:hypothetical protein [Niallia taxi]|uniref:hypothetical protein n=1 Tax=Niallia taxi TaxID=2499688 RepID=UPI002E1F7E6B|nr:hypothetical protein [Niallia taxi]
MFEKFKVILGFLAAILALLGTITDSTLIYSFMYLFLGLLFLVIGLSELKSIQKVAPILMILLAGLFILGSLYIMLFQI